MPKLREETKRERRDQITEAAWRCFARNGFAGTSMADIIAESGLSAGSIYSHFESKADLLQHVASQTLKLPASLNQRGFDSPGDAMRALAEHVGMRREFARLLLQVWAESTREDELSAVANRNLARLREWLGAGLNEWARARNMTPEQAADIALAAMQGYIARIALDSDVDEQRLLDTITGALNR